MVCEIKVLMPAKPLKIKFMQMFFLVFLLFFVQVL